MKYFILLINFVGILCASADSRAQDADSSLLFSNFKKAYSIKSGITFSINNTTNDTLYASIALEEKRDKSWSLVTDDVFKTHFQKSGVCIAFNPSESKEIIIDNIYYPVFDLSKSEEKYIKLKKPGEYRFKIEWNRKHNNSGIILYSPVFQLI